MRWLIFSILAFLVNQNLEAAWTLRQVYEASVQKHEGPKAAEAEKEQAEARLDQTVGRILPNINLLATYQRQQQQDAGAGLSAFAQAGQFNSRINVVQPLFRGLGDWAELRSRRYQNEALGSQVEAQKVDLFSKTAQTFYQVLAAEKDLENLKTLESLTLKRIGELSSRVRIGRSRSSELVSAQAQEASLQAQIRLGEGTVARAREDFSAATGLEANLPMEAPAFETIRIQDISQYLDAMANAPALKTLRLNASAQDASIHVFRSQHLPALDLSANYWIDRAGVLANTKWDFTLSLTVPIFAGGTMNASVEEAIERKKQATLQYELAERTTRAQVLALYRQVTSLLEQEKSLREATSLGEKNYEEQTKEYRLGLVTNLEVLQALNGYQETKRQLDKVHYDIFSLQAQLEATSGKVVF